jgi:hypothetical protein
MTLNDLWENSSKMKQLRLHNAESFKKLVVQKNYVAKIDDFKF